MLKFGLRKKIMLSYIFFIFMIVLISYLAVTQLVTLNNINDMVIKNNYQSIFAAQGMLKNIDNHLRIINMVASKIPNQRKEADKIFQDNRKELVTLIDVAKLNIRIEGEEELVKKIEISYNDCQEIIENLQQMNSSEEETIRLKTEARQKLSELRELSLELSEMNRDDMYRANKRAQDYTVQYITSTIIISIIAVVIGIALTFWLTHIMVGPMEDLTKAVTEIRRGNLDISVRTNYPDEIGILAQEFNKMAESIKTYKQVDLDKLLKEKSRTEAIIRSVGDCLIVIDKNYRIITINPTAERVFYLLPGISQGKDLCEMIKSEELYNIIKELVESGQDPSEMKSLPTFKWDYDRETKYFQVKVFPVGKEEEALIGHVILLEDITKLKEVDQLKSDFISIASHELRTPLTSIVMSLGMLLDGTTGELKLTEDQKELMEAANEESIRMKDLISALLDISKLESGRMEMDFAEIDPVWLVRGVASTFHVQAESKKILMNVQIQEDIKPIYADYNRIVQVFNNLLGNALRYTPQGGTLTLSAYNHENFVKFSVEDTGTGIAKEAQQKIFQKFVQIENDPNPGAAGLGLAVSSEIVKAHNGKMWVESEPGKGAKFSFLIPIYKNNKENL
jgi:PAS domain S-box-containing protein